MAYHVDITHANPVQHSNQQNTLNSVTPNQCNTRTSQTPNRETPEPMPHSNQRNTQDTGSQIVTQVSCMARKAGQSHNTLRIKHLAATPALRYLTNRRQPFRLGGGQASQEETKQPRRVYPTRRSQADQEMGKQKLEGKADQEGARQAKRKPSRPGGSIQPGGVWQIRRRTG